MFAGCFATIFLLFSIVILPWKTTFLVPFLPLFSRVQGLNSKTKCTFGLSQSSWALGEAAWAHKCCSYPQLKLTYCWEPPLCFHLSVPKMFGIPGDVNQLPRRNAIGASKNLHQLRWSSGGRLLQRLFPWRVSWSLIGWAYGFSFYSFYISYTFGCDQWLFHLRRNLAFLAPYSSEPIIDWVRTSWFSQLVSQNSWVRLSSSVILWVHESFAEFQKLRLGEVCRALGMLISFGLVGGSRPGPLAW